MILFSLLLFSACSAGDHSGGGSGGGLGGTPDAKNKEEALSRLSDFHRQKFSDWQKAVVKACDPSQAFGMTPSQREPQSGIDGAQLLLGNNGSAVFTDNANFVVLNGYTSFSGISNSKAQESRSINGKGFTLSAETKRAGTKCEVYLYGQKVYETAIVESFDIGFEGSTSKPAVTGGSDTLTVTPILASGGHSATVDQSGLFEMMNAVLRPSDKSIDVFVNKYGLQKEQAARLFKTRARSAAGSVVRRLGEPSAVWTGSESEGLIASPVVLAGLFDGSPKQLPLEIRLPLPEFQFGEIRNDKDRANLGLNLNILIQERPRNPSPSVVRKFQYKTASLVSNGWIAYDRDEAVQCSKDRARVYFTQPKRNQVGGSGRTNFIEPSLQNYIEPCVRLFNGIEKVNDESGLNAQLIPQVFAGVQPSKFVNYGGWDRLLSRLSLSALARGLDIRATLDASGRTRIVGLISEYLGAFDAEVKRSTNMSPIANELNSMGLTWAFRGMEVSGGRIAQIVRALDNARNPFEISVQQVLTMLEDQPDGSQEALAFAGQLDNQYKAAASRALALAESIQYSELRRSVFNTVLDRRPSLQEFADWSVRLTQVKSAIENYHNLGTLKGDLVGLSLGWMKSGEVSSQNLPAIYSAVDNVANPFPESTQQLLKSLAHSVRDNQTTLEFARTVTPEVKQIVLMLKEKSKDLGYASWGEELNSTFLQKKPSLEQLKAWENMWNSASQFTAREMARTKDEFGSSNARLVKDIITVAVKQSWTNREFEGLESIAQVARAKTTCDRYRGASELSDCANLRLFTKEKGMFFDPLLMDAQISFARDFAAYTARMTDFSWYSLKSSLLSEYFGSFHVMWSECNPQAFVQRASKLKSQLDQILRTTSFSDRFRIEQEIRETLKNCS